MHNIFRHIEQPTLNIESIGCYNPYADLQKEFREPKKVYVASLDYKINSLFRTTNKAVYIPIMFENENEIKLLFSHYDNLYFRIVEQKTYSEKHYYNEYHISEFININKIYKKTLSSIDYKPYLIEIQFFIKYHNYNIELFNRDHYYNRFNGFSVDDFNVNSLYEDDENPIINLFQKEKHHVPIFEIYYYPAKTAESLSEIIQHIDKIIEYKQKEKELVDSYYSKKSYKLVEEK